MGTASAARDRKPVLTIEENRNTLDLLLKASGERVPGPPASLRG